MDGQDVWGGEVTHADSARSATVLGRSNFGMGEDLCNFPATAVFDVAVLEDEHDSEPQYANWPGSAPLNPNNPQIPVALGENARRYRCLR